ncbi:hypothetical protein PHMEG_00012952 [Phytophthora megakarya]|uniref:Uncharacterized protein n=1 Tax=Phytophthora megakarya TaxID=4795 RepID=A0A225W9L6_9STRA|nr:hypothetical protein PHMEG_00012952 [Phytophthora megakarya]
MHSLLAVFSIFIQTKRSSRTRAADGLLSKSTALGYLSQVVNMLRERYTIAFADSKRIASITMYVTTFGLLFICYDEPSEHLFPLASRFDDRLKDDISLSTLDVL